MSPLPSSAAGASDAVRLDLAALDQGYRDGTLTPGMVVRTVLDRIAAAGEDHVWIHRVPAADLLARAASLEALTAAERTALPLYGVPFAVKDNIDVADMPTTAACPEYTYIATDTATAVQRLLDAGAILVGKTNLDQFATGLVGVRSPYGVARNPIDPLCVPGGSSSGSAVAVASGLVSFSLGTDTAGSGRVPAAFNNIVGLKPTKGLVSTAGVVPACRSLDCVSVFALTVEDAMDLLAVMAGPDPLDAYSRAAPAVPAAPRVPFRFGVPAAGQLRFFGNAEAERLYRAALDRLSALGGVAVPIDFAPFAEAAALLYSGPWVAERTAAVGEFLADYTDAGLEVTRGIIEGGHKHDAVGCFRAMYRLEALRRDTAPVWDAIDLLAVPTTGTIYTVAEVMADPVTLNTNLGTYTNFTNLLDLCGIAIPSGFQADGRPAGLTLLAPAFREATVAAVAGAAHRAAGVAMGATGLPLPPARPVSYGGEGLISLLVIGAHLSGQPLNPQLTDAGGRLAGAVTTAPRYRLYALPGEPARPGMLRVADGGVAIPGELWELTPAAFGHFVAGLPQPLCIGTVELADGRMVSGFLCEAVDTVGALDISGFGGWRAYLAR
ncbi:allophanate hydrolase [Azospirillum lipoferum]|uniref:Allophanate hydrolase n=1 Tax=Azospirillum lipoferum TaxID=193 RepID=A0A5A9GNR6_AZOLI|nr:MULTISPECIES: allophanate hydrolase [Azospirillum]KAA0595372.1 allophanate hydrolase [Azospirillum lipoferum]MCP1611734.1 allophanate hydrolase [Azospirillum lipoferum]MDW5533508.1 allophanate hydrolase [Azospirillum sp. NL1]